MCFVFSVLRFFILYSYNLLHSNRDCPRSNQRHNVKNLISLTPSKILFCSLELLPVAPNRRLALSRRAITIQQLRHA